MPITSLLHYALEVPDQTIGEKFYSSFGLSQLSVRDNGVHLRPAPLKRECVLLYPGARKRLHHIALGAPGDNFEQVKDALERAKVSEIDPPKNAPNGGIWVRDPDGNVLNIRNETAEPKPTDPPLTLNTPGRVLRSGERGCPSADQTSQPRRLGHVLLFSPNIDRQLKFYTEVLGFKLSDRSRNIVAFVRCDTDHHNLAFLTSPAPGFHHGSFEVGNIDELAIGAERMREAGFDPAWGPGRHVIGSNFFYYIRDPWGSFAEYFHDIDCIAADCAWKPQDFPEEDALYRWGPPVPPDFAENKELTA
jgi:catechol 2,3-dioxygenase-like lactoylglutathione lyase family enzyme